MALKYGSSSKSNNFKRSAFPMHSGTSNHTSAVKQMTSSLSLGKDKEKEEKSLDVQSAEFKSEIEKVKLKDQIRKLQKEKSDAETKPEVVKSSKTKRLEAAKEKREGKGKKFKRQGKLDESTMVDAMNPEEKMKHKQDKKDQRAIDIRNTIATIDNIIPKKFGGGRGTSGKQTLKDKPSYTDDSFWKDANKGGNPPPEESAGTESTSIKDNFFQRVKKKRIAKKADKEARKKGPEQVDIYNKNSPNKDIGPMGMFKKKVNKELETPAGQLAVKAATGGAL